MVTIQARLSRQCSVGGLQLSIENILTIIVLPVLLCTAAINDTCMVSVAITLPILLISAHYFCKKYSPQTRFFFTWAICSIVYLWIIFEITVPLLELLPEENFIFRVCIFGSIFCFYRAKMRAPMSVSRKMDEQSAVAEQRHQTRLLLENDDGDEEHVEIQKRFRHKRIPAPRALVHCDVCQQLIVSQYHHSRWLDCCISDSNVVLFLLGCAMGLFGLLFGSNLAMTSICHPFFFFNFFGVKILLPDDCSDVFEQYDMALAFVGAIYATAIGICGLLVFIKQIYQILVQKSELKRSCSLLQAYICCYRL